MKFLEDIEYFKKIFSENLDKIDLEAARKIIRIIDRLEEDEKVIKSMSDYIYEIEEVKMGTPIQIEMDFREENI